MKNLKVILVISIILVSIMKPTFAERNPAYSRSRHCAYNSDCPPGTICGPGELCRIECRADVDCAAGQTCYRNRDIQPAGVPPSYVHFYSRCVNDDAAIPAGIPTGELPQEQTNFVGSDIDGVVMTTEDWKECYRACLYRHVTPDHPAGPRCNAWTYIPKGSQGVVGYCWMKRFARGADPVASFHETATSGIIDRNPSNK